MADLAIQIKKIIKNYLENESLCDLVYGTYSGGGIKIDNKPIPIPADMVLIPTEYEAELSFTVNKEDLNADGEKIMVSVPQLDSLSMNKLPVKIKPKYQNGDRIIVGVKQGGQKYTIFGRL